MVFYIISLIILLGLYVLLIFLMRKFTNQLLTNIIFCVVIDACYIAVVIISLVKNGPKDWNFLNTLPTANVSPFMFALLPLRFVWPKKIRKYHDTLITLLSLGMLLAAVISIIFNIARNYAFHTSFLLDYIAHFGLSLFGIYLLLTNQSELKLKTVFISSSIIIAVAMIMLILNLILNQAFFGLALNEKCNIYNVKIVQNPYLSASLYFTGLVVVLVIGYFYTKLLTMHKKTVD